MDLIISIQLKISLFIYLFAFEKNPLGSGSVFPVVVDAKYKLMRNTT